MSNEKDGALAQHQKLVIEPSINDVIRLYKHLQTDTKTSIKISPEEFGPFKYYTSFADHMLEEYVKTHNKTYRPSFNRYIFWSLNNCQGRSIGKNIICPSSSHGSSGHSDNQIKILLPLISNKEDIIKYKSIGRRFLHD